MASTQDLKRRVRSITNTRKVTKAMELVASARLRRSQQRIEAMRPYADRMLELMAGVSKAAGAVRLPLLERREQIQKVAILPVTADRGLAGGFNAQVIRRSLALMREQQGEGPRGRLVLDRTEGRLDAALPAHERRAVVDRVQRASRVQRRADDRARRVGGVRERRGRHRVRRLQRVRLGAHAEGDGARAAADPHRPAREQRRRRRTRSVRRSATRTSSTSPSPPRSSRGSCRSTSRRSCTARCSSRLRPSRARA